jgi:F0F1-type ATP synthase epsilon subunit
MSRSQPPPSTAAKAMHVKIYAPFKVYYDAPATSMTAANGVGQFDVLQGHHNFISLLTPGEVTVRNDGKPDFKMDIDHGLIHVKADEVKVFLDV